MSELRISTMTAISSINSDINLLNLYQTIQPNDVITYLQHGSETKGTSKKAQRKSRTPKKQKSFFNQVTLHVTCEKSVNVKLFNNGKIQMTGLKYETHGDKVLSLLIPELLKTDSTSESKILSHNQIETKPFDTVMINSDFSLGYRVKRDVIHRVIVEHGMYSSYEPCIYPGVNIKYYFNQSTNHGICQCSQMCSGKGCGLGDGQCKRITILIFMSGEVIITGARCREQLDITHRFISKFIHGRRELFELKDE